MSRPSSGRPAPPSPRRPESAPSSRRTVRPDSAGSRNVMFEGIRAAPLYSFDAVIHSARSRSPGGTATPHKRPVPTQRDVLCALREKLLGIEAKKRYGEVGTQRPRFQISKRVDSRVYGPDVPDSLSPAPPPPAADRACAAERRSDKPLFLTSKTRKTIFDIQREAAMTESLAHTEPYVPPRPFAQALRLPEEATREYYDAALEAGYYKRWVYGINGERLPLPHSVEQFFGDNDEFESQDKKAQEEWRQRVLAAAGHPSAAPAKPSLHH